MVKFWEIEKSKGIVKRDFDSGGRCNFIKGDQKLPKLSFIPISFPLRIKNKYLVKLPTKRKSMTLQHYIR